MSARGLQSVRHRQSGSTESSGFTGAAQRARSQRRPHSDIRSHRPVSTALSLFDLALGADRAGLFCNFTPEPNTGCYLWTGRTTKQGYGVVSINRKTVTTHRAVYRLCVDDIGDELDVHHICEQPGCIYPEHLTALTPEQHRCVHTGRGRAWNVFVERFRVDPFEHGVFGFGLPSWFRINVAALGNRGAQRPADPPAGAPFQDGGAR